MIIFDVRVVLTTDVYVSVVVVVNGAVDIGIVVHVFHNVNFSALRPTDRAYVLSEHPERRPKTLSGGSFQSSFYLSIFKRKFVFGNKTSGRIIAGVNDLLFGKNVKFAVAGEAVVRTGGVVLKFVVSPTPIACT